MSETASIVQRVWNYCHVLRDDGVSYGDYLEQLTYLLFLKMADEKERELGQPAAISAEYGWPTLRDRRGEALESHYRSILAELGKGTGLIPTIFRKAQSKIQDPAKLARLVRMIDQEVWLGLPLDVKADIYEGLLEKNAQDIKSGAGQYFTPGRSSRPWSTSCNPGRARPSATPPAAPAGFCSPRTTISRATTVSTATSSTISATRLCAAGRSSIAPPGWG